MSLMEDFKLVLDISFNSSKSSCIEVLRFPSTPATSIEIMTQIEELHSIPTCFKQFLTKVASEIEDVFLDSDFNYLRSGDLFYLTCPSQGHVKDLYSGYKIVLIYSKNFSRMMTILMVEENGIPYKMKQKAF